MLIKIYNNLNMDNVYIGLTFIAITPIFAQSIIAFCSNCIVAISCPLTIVIYVFPLKNHLNIDTIRLPLTKRQPTCNLSHGDLVAALYNIFKVLIPSRPFSLNYLNNKLYF